MTTIRSIAPGLACAVAACVMLPASPSAVQAQVRAGAECEGLAAGSLVLSEEVAAVFVVRYAGRDVLLETLFVARGDAGWATDDFTFQPWRRPKLPDSTTFLTGASVGRLFMQYEPATRTAWVHTTKAPLGGSNVVVIERAHAESPLIRSVFRVDPQLGFPDACQARAQNDYAALRAAVLEKLLRTPALKRLIDGGSSSRPELVAPARCTVRLMEGA